jgi:Bacterial Ig-like domain
MRRTLGLALVVVTLCAGPPANASALTAAEDPFCTPQVLVDYEAPLRGLPEVREPPTSGRLPFGPRRLRFGAIEEPGNRGAPGVIEGEGIEYGLRLEGDYYGPAKLGWRIESRLVRVDRDGRGSHVIKRRMAAIDLLEPAGARRIGFARSPVPGLYRYDLIFRDTDGELLGHYHRHYLVLPDEWNVTLALNATSFRVGENLHAQVRNYGTRSLSYGVGFSIERYDGAWAPIDNEAVFGHKLVFIMIGLNLGAGNSDDCSSGFTIPEKMTPGLYRIVKRFGIGRDERLVSAEFTVVP